MYGTLPLSGPGDGLFPPTVQHIKIRNATNGGTPATFAPGSVVMLDVGLSSTTTTAFTPGHATSGADDAVFNCCVLPTAAGIAAGYPILVCEETITAGSVGKATLMGPTVQAKVGVASGNIASGAVLVPTAGTDIFVSTVSATNATWMPGCWALAASTSTTATSASTVLAAVWLNGRFLG